MKEDVRRSNGRGEESPAQLPAVRARSGRAAFCEPAVLSACVFVTNGGLLTHGDAAE